MFDMADHLLHPPPTQVLPLAPVMFPIGVIWKKEPDRTILSEPDMDRTNRALFSSKVLYKVLLFTNSHYEYFILGGLETGN